jgi:hypothetical protein
VRELQAQASCDRLHPHMRMDPTPFDA